MRPVECECGYTATVIEIRYRKVDGTTYRRMQCKSCGKRWSTVTVRKEQYDKAVKAQRLLEKIMEGVKYV